MTPEPGPPESLSIDPEERIDLLLRHLGTRREGLSEREAARRLEQYGPNEIRRRQGSSRLRELARQFTHPLALLLWVAALLLLATFPFMVWGTDELRRWMMRRRVSRAVERPLPRKR